MLIDTIFALNSWELSIDFENLYQFETLILTCLILWHFKAIFFFLFFDPIGNFAIFQDFLELNTAANNVWVTHRKKTNTSIEY